MQRNPARKDGSKPTKPIGNAAFSSPPLNPHPRQSDSENEANPTEVGFAECFSDIRESECLLDGEVRKLATVGIDEDDLGSHLTGIDSQFFGDTVKLGPDAVILGKHLFDFRTGNATGRNLG